MHTQKKCLDLDVPSLASLQVFPSFVSHSPDRVTFALAHTLYAEYLILLFQFQAKSHLRRKKHNLKNASIRLACRQACRAFP